MKAVILALLLVNTNAYAAKDCKVVANDVAQGILTGINRLVGGPGSKFKQEKLEALPAETKKLHLFQTTFTNSVGDQLFYRIELANDPYLNCVPYKSSLVQ